MNRICILGSTGSIGASTLEVIARHPDRYQVLALTANRQVDELVAQCRTWRPRYAAMGSARHARLLREQLRQEGLATEVLEGEAGLCALARHEEIDTVMAAIVGAAGLKPCMAAARAGKRLLLANKEALVVGGASFMAAVRTGGATLLPIDSEHSAIFQCLPQQRAEWPAWIERIVLTASGGPFRRHAPEQLATVTPEQACAHPNWVMGRKISVDSATMMNKALEVIEAHWLFDIEPERIEVVIHPQSIVHSMVVCRDGSVLAQMGTPDMKVPIGYGLSFPERIESGAARLDFANVGKLSFETPDRKRFPGLFLAWDALRGPHGTAAVLNAANEVAVEAFLEGRLPFVAIHEVNAATMDAVVPGLSQEAGVDELIALDQRARQHASDEVRRRTR